MKKARMEERTCMHPLQWEPYCCQEVEPTFLGKRETPRNRGRHHGGPKPLQPYWAAWIQTSVHDQRSFGHLFHPLSHPR